MRVADSVISAHSRGLKSHKAIYHLNRVDINTFTVTKGIRDFIKDPLFTSQIRNVLVTGLLKHDAFHVNISKDPLNFQHYDLIKLSIYRHRICSRSNFQAFNQIFFSTNTLS